MDVIFLLAILVGVVVVAVAIWFGTGVALAQGMRILIRLSLVLLVCAVVIGVPGRVSAQELESWRAMNRPWEPFTLIGNLHYVGASDIAVYLLTTPEGHILIDGGFEETVPIILAGIDKLGYDAKDVKILLHSHAHIDHVGGLAKLKELTGARLMASELDAPMLEAGGRGDPLLGDRARFPAVKVDRRLGDGDRVELGGTTLTARITPGHTRGCTSWVLDVEEGGKRYRAVSIGSLSVLDGMRLLDEPTYAGIAEDFPRSFAVLRSLDVDVFLGSHARFFKMKEKRERQQAGDGANPFVDPEGYRAFVDRAEQQFRDALGQERAVSR